MVPKISFALLSLLNQSDAVKVVFKLQGGGDF